MTSHHASANLNEALVDSTVLEQAASAVLAYKGQGPRASESVASLSPAQASNVIGRRLVACLVDCTLVALLSLVAFAPLLFVRPGLVLALAMLLVFVLLFCVLYTFYVALLEGFWGWTIGKSLLGIEVIREEDGGVPGPGRAVLRTLTFLFVDMFAGVFVMLASQKCQRPGDMAANTLVVRERRG